VVDELLASRAAIHVLVAEIDEVLLAEATLGLNARGERFAKRYRNAGFVTRKDFLTAVVAPIGNGFELVDAENFLRPASDVGKLCSI
jgi:hypothetical protein